MLWGEVTDVVGLAPLLVMEEIVVDLNLASILREISMLQRRLYTLVDVSYATGWKEAGAAASTVQWNVPLDLIEDNQGYVLVADMPGVNTDDLRVEVKGNKMLLSGMRGETYESEPQAVYRIERPLGVCKREITLPEEVDADSVEATLDDGVLTVKMPLARPRSREIKVM